MVESDSLPAEVLAAHPEIKTFTSSFIRVSKKGTQSTKSVKVDNAAIKPAAIPIGGNDPQIIVQSSHNTSIVPSEEILNEKENKQNILRTTDPVNTIALDRANLVGDSDASPKTEVSTSGVLPNKVVDSVPSSVCIEESKDDCKDELEVIDLNPTQLQEKELSTLLEDDIVGRIAETTLKQRRGIFYCC